MITPGENGRSATRPRSASELVAEALAEPSIRAQAPLRSLDAQALSPMLAEAAEHPFSGPDWIFELKIDGYRALLDKRGNQAHIYYRRGREVGAIYPELLEALHALPFAQLLIDGELAVLDARGRPSFAGLQQRSGLENARDISAASVDYPVVYFAFDLLAAEGRDLRGLPLLERKRLLALVLAQPRPERSGAIRYVGHVAGSEGERLFSRARALALEGIVGKRAQGPYRSGRSGDWRKLRVEKTADFAIAGCTEGRGARSELGALQLAAWDGNQFVYAGAAGSGLRQSELAPLAHELRKNPLPKPPCLGAPRIQGATWCEPRLVCEVRYVEVTADGLLRHPVFLRMRPDKTPRECPPVAAAPLELASAPPRAAGRVDVASRASLAHLPESALRETPGRVKLSNPGKLLWPDDGITKSDLIAYYRAIAPYILPWLRDRPATLTRYPDGIAGKSFFQKHAASYTPEWVRVSPPLGSDQIEAIVCDDLDTLVYIANLANIPIHIPSERLSEPGRPDTVTLDLDPKTAPFAHVVRIALELRESCERLGLPCFVKTSGQSGLHVVLPLGGRCSHEEAAQLAELLARLVEARLPKLCTLQRMIEKRQGKVYLDIGQNGATRTVAAAYSVRPVPGARASAPLLWDELDDSLDPAAFTLRTLPERARKLGADPLLGALTLVPDLERALARLAELQASSS